MRLLRQIHYTGFLCGWPTRLLLFAFLFPHTRVCAQVSADTSHMLKPVKVTAELKQNPFTTITPVQKFNRDAILQTNAETIAGVAKYFSGVLIKDYGGVGGLKTISVRSLGGLNTGLVYDGITIADAQTGQVDLSRYSSVFVQTLELDQANPSQILNPARVYASASILSFTSSSFRPAFINQEKWITGINAGSFGFWQPYAGISMPVGKKMSLSVNGEATWSQGDYPYLIENGMFSQKTTRTNSDLKSFQGELNTLNIFNDSSTLQVKGWAYFSERGLPGSVIYFNDVSAQRLKDGDFFIQGRYRKAFSGRTTLLASAKYSSFYSRYTDPNFLNNAGGLDDQYTQNEIYGSGALSHGIGNHLIISFASDLAYTTLNSNIPHFAEPRRLSLWNNLTVRFNDSHWQVSAALLNTQIHDQTQTNAGTNANKFTPSLALGYKTNAGSPVLLRAFYKEIFRMPTFNDLYYTYNANINPKLNPEYSSQFDLGLTFTKNLDSRVRQIQFSVDGYFNKIKDKIIAVPTQNLFIWTMKNIGKVQILGVDLNAEAAGRFSQQTRWSVRLAYTGQQALDKTDPASPLYNNKIPYTPDHSGSGLATIYHNNWSAGYSILFSSSRYVLGENNPENEMSGWNTQDIFLSRQFDMRKIRSVIRLECNNVFDERYDVIRYYPMPGRSFKISITINNI